WLPPDSHSPTPSTTAPSTLSLHDALPIFSPYILDNSILDAAASKFITRGIASAVMVLAMHWAEEFRNNNAAHSTMTLEAAVNHRSEEHTSELQSRFDLVCRLLLEKKNRTR